MTAETFSPGTKGIVTNLVKLIEDCFTPWLIHDEGEIDI